MTFESQLKRLIALIQRARDNDNIEQLKDAHALAEAPSDIYNEAMSNE